MTYTERNIVESIRALVGDNEPVEFNLNWLIDSMNKSQEIISDLKEEVQKETGLKNSYKLNFEIEEKWRRELQEELVSANKEIIQLQIDAIDTEVDLELALDAVAVDNWEESSDKYHEYLDAIHWFERCVPVDFVKYRKTKVIKGANHKVNNSEWFDLACIKQFGSTVADYDKTYTLHMIYFNWIEEANECYA